MLTVLLNNIQSAVILGVIWGIMALGVYLTYRVLNYADLTVDGSFTLGGAMSAVYIAAGIPPLAAILLATLGGMIAGLVTGVLHTKFKIPDLLAGILCQFALYSVNLRVMGKANVALLNVDTIFTQVEKLGVPSEWSGLVVGLIFVVVLILLMYSFFGTEIGCALRATGNNPDMVKAQGTNTKIMVVLGLVIGNGLVAMSGALLAQYQGYADVQMGVGTIVFGLAAVIIGEVIFSKKTYFHRLAGVIIGSVVYRIIIALVLLLGQKLDFEDTLGFKIVANDTKLITAIIVVICLVSPSVKSWIVSKRSKEGA